MIYTGVHIGDTSTTTLTVSGTPWGPGPHDPEVYWKKVRNITDSSSGLIRDNTQNTVTVPAGITGGTNNEWRTGDEAKIYDVPYLQWYRPWQNY
ncbi:MAG: hypothetical protein H8D67_19205 [Deltaproteobacteria bacterium]|nr:hypothetical protein [Deltaproteobacteria bacterium]